MLHFGSVDLKLGENQGAAEDMRSFVQNSIVDIFCKSSNSSSLNFIFDP